MSRFTVFVECRADTRTCAVTLPDKSELPSHIRGRTVIGRCVWNNYQGVVSDGENEVWRGSIHSTPEENGVGTVTVGGVAYTGRAIIDGKNDAATKALLEAQRYIALKAKGEKSVTAEYRGEWLLQNQAFVVLAPDGKEYAWIVSREIPAMSYKAQGESDANAVAGPATWLSDGQHSFDSPGSVGMDASEKAGFSHPQPNGENVQPVISPRGGVIDAEFDELGATRTKPRMAVTVARLVGKAIGTVLGNPETAIAVSVGAYYVGSYAAHKIMKHYAAKKAAKLAAAVAPASSGGGESRKPPMPGWPAINFRGGKKAKTSTKKKASEYALAIEIEKNHKASFDMADGSIDKLKCMALTATVRDQSGDLVWSTSQLHIPVEQQDKLLVPVDVQLIAYAVTLLNEAAGYIDFIESEPDMTASVEAEHRAFAVINY